MTIMEEFTANYKDALAETVAECSTGVKCYGMLDYTEGWKDITNPFDHIEDMDADTLDWVACKLEEQLDQLEKIHRAICKLAEEKRRLENIADYED